MKCFTHRNNDAVAICRSCGRALCPDCVAEVGLSCACKNRCESDVKRSIELITRDRPVPINPAGFFGYDRVIFIMTMGLGFIGCGVYNFGSHGVNWAFIALGMAFFIFG